MLIHHLPGTYTSLLQEPELEEEKARNFSILQPGSSVATALSEGESKRKHIMVLEIMGEQWRTIKVALKTVRPFIFESVSRHAPFPDEACIGVPELCTAAFTAMFQTCPVASATLKFSAVTQCSGPSVCKPSQLVLPQASHSHG